MFLTRGIDGDNAIWRVARLRFSPEHGTNKCKRLANAAEGNGALHTAAHLRRGLLSSRLSQLCQKIGVVPEGSYNNIATIWTRGKT